MQLMTLDDHELNLRFYKSKNYRLYFLNKNKKIPQKNIWNLTNY